MATPASWKGPGFPLFLLVMSMLTDPLLAQTSQTFYSVAGERPSDVLASTSVRAVVFGPALTAVADGPSVLFLDPGGLGHLTQAQVEFDSFYGNLDSIRGAAIFCLPLEQAGVAGLGVGYLNYGSFEGRDELGSVTTGYGADRVEVQGGWGKNLFPGFSAGAGVHFSRQDLVGTVLNGVQADCGTLWEFERGLRLGLDYLIPGWVEGGSPLVSALRVGISKDLELPGSSKLLIALGGSLQSNGSDHLQAGMEWSLGGSYFLEAGYGTDLNDHGVSGFSNAALGAGMVLGEMRFDYAYSPAGILGDSHRISLGYSLGPKETVQNKENPPEPTGEQSALVPEKAGQGAILSQGTEESGAGRVPVDRSLADPSGAVSQDQGGSSQAPTTVFVQSPPTLAGIQPQMEGAADKKNNLTLSFEIPDDYLSQGEQMARQGSYSEAIKLYRQAVEQDPKNVKAWWDMGDTYYRLRQKALAIDCFEKALELRPDNKVLRGWLDRYRAQKP
ncbi:MAG TPA: tetratricopeptide repeat protein [bacterium]|nr:tetratricopeptide repeat protein [bacterium]